MFYYDTAKTVVYVNMPSDARDLSCWQQSIDSVIDTGNANENIVYYI